MPDRRHSWALLLGVALAAMSMGCQSADAKRPNFLFVLVDDLGWTDLGCYGSTFYETPHLDRMADEGTTFTSAYAASPVCSPTRAAIMTGQYPTRVGITDWIPGNDPRDRALLGPPDLHALPQSQVTLAEALHQEGFRTFFAGKWHLGDTASLPEHHGFDINHGGHHRGSPPGGYYTPYDNPKLADGPPGEYLTDRLTSETISFIQEGSEQPFFAFLSYYTVHTPIQPNLEHIDRFRSKRSQLADTSAARIPERQGLTVTNQYNADYASMVYAMDRNVGRLMDTLRSTGRLENTVVIFTSDNGGLSTLFPHRTAPTSVRPLRAGKGWCYEGGIRVPLIMAGRGIPQGKVIDDPVISMDFYPTILAMAGLPAPAHHTLDGISLVPALDGQPLDGRSLFWHFPHYHGSAWTPGAAIRHGPWKLVQFYEQQTYELYDLSQDLGETRDLSLSHSDTARILLSKLTDLQQSTGAILPTRNPDAE